MDFLQVCDQLLKIGTVIQINERILSEETFKHEF